ncbi:MAG TPA: PEP-CTERM sorting domain-containing protein [Candidatus Limnocylindrales bacterium]|nr:PEP-CTERM sorting domain-containing protein [Candidatus Limnocylindrales bacterium]
MKLIRVLFGISVLAVMATGLAARAGALNVPGVVAHAAASVTLAHVFASITAAAQPEPTSLILFGMGGLVLLNIRRRRKTA